MPSITANNIELAYREYGCKSDTPVLLIMGLGAQLSMWPPLLINSLVEKGYRVIAFDNRDIGLSQKFPDVSAPNPIAQTLLRRVGIRVSTPYSLLDMAADASGLLAALKVNKAHVVGVSMGGMIAQLLAANYPSQVLSLTAISSTTNNPSLPSSDFRVLLALAKRKTAFPTRAGAVNQTLQALHAIGTRGEDPWVNGLRDRVEESYERSYYPVGTSRQLAAIVATGDLRRWSNSIQAPTLVVHGTADPLVPFTGGKDILRTVSGAQLLTLEGMGHDLPERFIRKIVSRMTYLFGISNNIEHGAGKIAS